MFPLLSISRFAKCETVDMFTHRQLYNYSDYDSNSIKVSKYQVENNDATWYSFGAKRYRTSAKTGLFKI